MDTSLNGVGKNIRTWFTVINFFRSAGFEKDEIRKQQSSSNFAENFKIYFINVPFSKVTCSPIINVECCKNEKFKNIMHPKQMSNHIALKPVS